MLDQQYSRTAYERANVTLERLNATNVHQPTAHREHDLARASSGIAGEGERQGGRKIEGVRQSASRGMSVRHVIGRRVGGGSTHGNTDTGSDVAAPDRMERGYVTPGMRNQTDTLTRVIIVASH